MIWGTWLFTLALLVAIAVATGSGDSAEPAARPLPEAAPVAVIAERVEAIRGLRFSEPPVPERVSAEQAREEGLEALDRDYPPRRRERDEAILELLGLVEPGLDLRDVASSVYGTQVAGYYDPETRRLRIVGSAATSSRAYTEIVLAHELTHALEDQRFRLRFEDLSGLDDRSLAYATLVEGTASALMFEYADRHFSSEEVLVGLLGSAFAPPGDIPAFLQAQLAFPYITGQDFAERLYAAAGRRWTLIDAALRHRPPVSSEQVMHADSYLRFEEPLRVRLRAGAALGRGWRRASAGTLGEWQTAQVLRKAGGGGSVDAAAGWGGDRFELWERGEERALVVRWRWDSAADRGEFLAALGAYVADGAPGAPAAIDARGGAVTLAIAPDAATAARLARAPD